MPYDKPKVTIDLEEYLAFKDNAKRASSLKENCRSEVAFFMRIITHFMQNGGYNTEVVNKIRQAEGVLLQTKKSDLGLDYPDELIIITDKDEIRPPYWL